MQENILNYKIYLHLVLFGHSIHTHKYITSVKSYCKCDRARTEVWVTPNLSIRDALNIIH